MVLSTICSIIKYCLPKNAFNLETKETGTRKTVSGPKASSKDVKDQLAREAAGNANGTEKAREVKSPLVVPEVSIDNHIRKFEKLKGLAANRERLNQT